jgi:hypothetical protein
MKKKLLASLLMLAVVLGIAFALRTVDLVAAIRAMHGN